MRRFPNQFVFLPAILIAAFFLGACGTSNVTGSGNNVPSCSSDTNWSFVVFGDTRSNPDVFAMHVANIAALYPTPDMIFHTGDFIMGKSPDLEWSIFEQVMGPISHISFHGVVGNHDDTGSTAGAAIFKKETKDKGGLYYSVKHDDTLFIILDTEEPDHKNDIVGAQLAWLKDQLASTDAKRIIALTHHPLFPQGHYKNGGLSNADEIHSLFLQYGVKLVFSGHEHQFFHNVFDGITYVITGGGGAPLYHENGGDFYHFILACSCDNEIDLKVVALDGSLYATYKVPLN